MLVAYDTIVDSLASSSGPSNEGDLYLSLEEILAGMKVLAMDRTPGARIARLQSMYTELSSVFGYEPTKESLNILMLGTLRNGDPTGAVKLVKGVPGDLVDWTEMLRMTTRYAPRNFDLVWLAMTRQRSPHVQDYQALLRCVRREMHRGRSIPKTLMDVLESIRRTRVSVGTLGEAELIRICILEGRSRDAEEILASWNKTGKQGEMLEREGWLAKVAWAVHRQDRSQVEELCLSMKECGILPPGWAMAFLIQHELASGHTMEEATNRVEMVTESATPLEGWTILVQSLVKNKPTLEDLEQALATYRLARRRGVEIDTRLAQAIIRPLFTQAEQTIDAMVEVYEDVLRTSSEIEYDIEDDRRLAELTRILLKGCAKSDPPRCDMALRLLQEAAERGIAIPDVRAAMTRLMRHSPNHETSYDLYKTYLSNNAVDADAHRDFVNAFLTVAPAGDPYVIPSVERALQMISNMRSQGAEPDHKILTSILSRYGQLGSMRADVPWDIHQQRTEIIRNIIRVIHTRIKLGANIETDLPLLIALMDAYNRVDAVEEALLVWNDIVDRRKRLPVEYAKKHYPAGIAIALDTCAYRGNIERAQKIWAWGKRHGLVGTTRVWNGWVECLCRMGLYSRALEVATAEMGHGDAPAPDAETVRRLAKFMWRLPDDERLNARSVLKEKFPQHREVIDATAPKAGHSRRDVHPEDTEEGR